MVKKQKNYSKSKNVKKLKIFSFKIHKSAGISKKPKTFLNNGTKNIKNSNLKNLTSFCGKASNSAN